MPKIYADNTGGGASLPIDQSDVTGLPAALDGKVSKSGDTMTGQLNVNADVDLSGGSGSLHLPDAGGIYGQSYLVAGGSIAVDAFIEFVEGSGLYLHYSSGGFQFNLQDEGIIASDGISAPAFTTVPQFKTVPLTGTKRLTLSRDNNKGLVVVTSCPTDGSGTVRLPNIFATVDGAYRIVNGTAYALTVDYVGINPGIYAFGSGLVSTVPLPAWSMVEFTAQKSSGYYYQTAKGS